MTGTQHRERHSNTPDRVARTQQRRAKPDKPETYAQWASVMKGFRVVIRELLTELGRKDYSVKECRCCGLIREHSPKGRRCRDCWRRLDKQREIDYKNGFTRPRNYKTRGKNGRYTRTYIRKETNDA